MVREFGLSSALGPVGYGTGSSPFLGAGPTSERPYSEETQRVIDTEVARLLREAEDRACGLLREHRDALDVLTAELLDHETVTGDVVRAIAAGATPATRATAGAGRPRPPEH
jgi:cell division protease FtsH